MAKNDELRIRCSMEEKQDFINRSIDLGFDSLSAYVLWLLRNDCKKNS